MMTKVLGVLIFIGGVVLILASNNIAERVAAGRGEISSGQRKVDTANELFSMNQRTKPIGGLVTGSAQDKINAGTQEADKYDRLAGQLQTGGYVLCGVGIVVFIIGCFRRKK